MITKVYILFMAVMIVVTALVGLGGLFGLVNQPVVAIATLLVSGLGALGLALSYFMKEDDDEPSG
jgi:hypothetical protein